jgi:predicted RNase H-like nuclease (RuvC/YqgF family)
MSKELKDKIDKLNEENKALSDMVGENNSEIKRLEAVAENYEKHIEKLNEDIACLERQFVFIDDTLNNHIEDRDKRIKELKAELEKLRIKR